MSFVVVEADGSRPKRARHQPLQWWKCERFVYRRDQSADDSVPVVDAEDANEDDGNDKSKQEQKPKPKKIVHAVGRLLPVPTYKIEPFPSVQKMREKRAAAAALKRRKPQRKKGGKAGIKFDDAHADDDGEDDDIDLSDQSKLPGDVLVRVSAEAAIASGALMEEPDAAAAANLDARMEISMSLPSHVF